MEFNELLNFEINQFKNGWGKTANFSEINYSNTKKVLSKALNDTLAMATKRKSTTYKDIENEFLDCFINDFIGISKSNLIKVNSNDEFNKLFDILTNRYISKMKELGKEVFASYGFAQKFISMSFKYMYCFNDSIKDNFKFCKLPLDKYTINWYKKYGNKATVNEFKKIGFSWSEINKELYQNIQNNIDEILKNNCKYQINCADENKTIILPQNKLEVEFVVWQQERLNEVYNELIKFKDYYTRLGIYN